MIASNQMNFEAQQLTSQIVPLPKIAMASNSGPWPACVGMTGEECTTYIQEYTTGLTIVIVPEGSMVTADFREDRVRIWVDSDGFVVVTPNKG